MNAVQASVGFLTLFSYHHQGPATRIVYNILGTRFGMKWVGHTVKNKKKRDFFFLASTSNLNCWQEILNSRERNWRSAGIIMTLSNMSFAVNEQLTIDGSSKGIDSFIFKVQTEEERGYQQNENLVVKAWPSNNATQREKRPAWFHKLTFKWHRFLAQRSAGSLMQREKTIYDRGKSVELGISNFFKFVIWPSP